MDIEKLIVRLMADASSYTRTMDGAIAKAVSTAKGIGGAFKSLATGDAFSAAGNAIKNAVLNPLSTVKSVVSGATSVLTTVLGGGLSLVANVASGVFSTAMSLVTTGLMAVVAVTALAGMEAIKLAAEYEQASIAFEVMTGSAEKGKETLDAITKLGVETPFTSRSLISTAQQLSSFGIEADQLVPTLRALGDVASGGTGGSLDSRMQRLSLAFGQVMTAGRLMGTELKQFNEAGVPLIKYLAKVMHEDETAIKGLVEQGRVGSAHVVMAFNAMTGAGGRFENMMDRQSKGITGRWSTLVDTIQLALKNLGMSFIQGFGLNELLQQWTAAVNEIGSGTGQLEGIFTRLRGIFDSFVNAVSAVGKGLFEAIFGATSFTWDDVEQTVNKALRGIIEGMGGLLEILRQVGLFIMKYLVYPLVQGVAALENFSTIAKFQAGMINEEERNKRIMASESFQMVRTVSSGIRAIENMSPTQVFGRILADFDRRQLENRRGGIGPTSEETQARFLVAAQEQALQEFQDKRRATMGGVAGGLGVDPFILSDYQTISSMRKSYIEARTKELMQTTPGTREFTESQRQQMRVEWQPGIFGGNAREVADKLKKEMMNGTSALAQFTDTMKDLDEALGMKTGGFAFGLDRIKGIINQQEADFGAYKAFMELRKSVGDRLEAKLPPALTAGSQEAQDVINRSTQKTASWQDQVLQVMEAAKAAEEEQAKDVKEIVSALKEYAKKNPPPTVRGKGI